VPLAARVSHAEWLGAACSNRADFPLAQVADFSSVVSTSSTGATSAQPAGAVGLSSGCPPGWRLFKRACYRRMASKPLVYNDAQAQCQAQGVRRTGKQVILISS
jgi:hypothetical protein